MTEGGSGRGAPLVRAAKYAALGLEFLATILGGLFLGYYLDLYFGTSPWLFTLVTLLSLVGALYRMARLAKKFSSERA